MPEARLTARLKTEAGVLAIIAGKVYPIMVPDGTVLPYITYHTITDLSINHATGATEGNTDRIQVDCWAATYAGVKALANAVKTALKNWTDTTDSPHVTSCHYESGTDLPEQPVPGREIGRYRVSQDYFLGYVYV